MYGRYFFLFFSFIAHLLRLFLHSVFLAKRWINVSHMKWAALLHSKHSWVLQSNVAFNFTESPAHTRWAMESHRRRVVQATGAATAATTWHVKICSSKPTIPCSFAFIWCTRDNSTLIRVDDLHQHASGCSLSMDRLLYFRTASSDAQHAVVGLSEMAMLMHSQEDLLVAIRVGEGSSNAFMLHAPPRFQYVIQHPPNEVASQSHTQPYCTPPSFHTLRVDEVEMRFHP